MAEEQEQVVFTPEQQALVDKLVGDARVKARERAAAEADTQRVKDEADAEKANLAASEEWEKLAVTHEARVKELEPVAETVKAYATFIESVLESTIKDLGKDAKSAVAGLPEKMTAMDKLTWLNANAALFQEPTGDGVGTPNPSKTPTTRPKIDSVNRYGPIKL